MASAGTILGEDASKLKSTIDRTVETAGAHTVNSPAAFPVNGRQARLSVDLIREPVIIHNVIGMVEGADPELKQQVVVIGAHMDHDGIDADGRIFNGADDNASGTAGVLRRRGPSR
jgi:Zn-dependent M28 family amino/carboxypeptidase